MTHAYTPGLRVSSDTIIRKRRLLPILGEVLVTEGEQVTATTEVAQTALPGSVYPLNIANKLSISPGEIHRMCLKQEGTDRKGCFLPKTAFPQMFQLRWGAYSGTDDRSQG